MTFSTLLGQGSLLLGLILSAACSKDESVRPTAEALSASASGVQNVTIGAYDVAFQGVSYGNNTTTYTYSIRRTGPAKANGLSHWIVSLPNGCTQAVTFRSVVGATLDGKAYTNLAGSEGRGAGCTNAVGANILKFDNLPSGVSDGAAHTFTFTLNGTYYVGTAPSWVKFGNNCQEGQVQGPSCQNPGSGTVPSNDQ
ncbi:hypothetical protein [Hymenobacter latericus]|uniref:hypothetical protein n=1 Tax=Hymenobacter sp. YIM 151858-1 TaxID=2987688 RepID=UPI002225F470|nr:hypothetical protein [Hymenobacter sp. YIM 151858-1]UYZ58542.1 hypothetical protein OIS50_15960 [Hymenobacter sp. YIM 151858-1]